MKESKFQILSDERSNPKVFFEELQKIIKEDNYDKLELISFVTNNKISLDIVTTEYINNGESIFWIRDLLKEVFSEVPHEVNDLLELIKTSHSQLKGDGAAQEIYKLYGKLYKRQPQLTDELLEKLLGIDEEYVFNYISTIFIAKSDEDIGTTHSELVLLLRKKKSTPLFSVISALSGLKYNGYKNKEDETIKAYKWLIDKNKKESYPQIVFSLNNFLSTNENAKILFWKLAELKQIEVISNIAWVLATNKECRNSGKFKQVVLNVFTTVESKYIGVLNRIDSMFSEIFRQNPTDEDFSLFEVFLNQWFLNVDYGRDDSLNKLFKSTLYQIKIDNNLFSKLITNLLNSNHKQCHIAVADIVNNIVEKANSPRIYLNNEIIINLEFEDILYISRKILGYIPLIDKAYPLLDSIIFNFAENNKVVGLICSIYINHLGKAYPGTTKKLVQESIKTYDNKDSIIHEYLSRVIEEISNKDSEYKLLPRLKELYISEEKMKQVNKAYSNMMSELKDDADKNSWMSFMTKILLKYGKGSFHYDKTNEEYSEISKLGLVSTSIEYPYTEITSPIDSEFERLVFRNVKRGDK